jgi:hypothetical protein
LGSGTGGSTITDGSGTTANGTAVDLGGTQDADVVITGTTQKFTIESNNAVVAINDSDHVADGIKIVNTSDDGETVIGSEVGSNYGQVNTFASATDAQSQQTAVVSGEGLSYTVANAGAINHYLEAGSKDASNNGTSINLTPTAGTVTMTGADPAGLQYAADYSADYTDRSLVDKEYVDNVAGGTVRKDKVITATTYEITDADNGYNIHFTNASGTEVTIPAGLMDSIYFTGIRDDGAGQVDFTGDGTSVLQSVGGELSLEVENAAVTWFKRDEDTFQGFGLLGPTGGSGEPSDGDKGDVTVTDDGATWIIDNLAVTAAKLATLSSSDLAGKLTDEAGTGLVTFSEPDVNTQTGSYTLVLADRAKEVRMNVAGANNLTIPLNSTVAFPTGTMISITQYGAGTTTVVATGGVTVRSSSGIMTSPGQYSPMMLKKIATNEWFLWNGSAPIVTASGTYTPTLTNGTNVAASTAYLCTYMRVGNTVTVSGRVDIDPTAATTATLLGISLPVGSAFTTANQCAGTAAAQDVESQSAAIRGDLTNDRAEMAFITTSASNEEMYFTFTYQIL